MKSKTAPGLSPTVLQGRRLAAVPPEDEFRRFEQLEARIGESESTGLRARWDFGCELLAERVGGKLPAGRVAAVAARVGAAPSELRRRMLFAERFADEQRFDHAVITYRSWHELVNRGLAPERGDAEQSTRAIEDGTFRTIVADPPWRYGNQATRAATSKHYATLAVEDLISLEVEVEGFGSRPVVDIAADDAHLYLWTTNGFLREAFDVVDAWGFTYRTCLTWVKPQWGIGNYFRPKTEHVFFCTRGRLPIPESKREANVIEARRTRHSKKPDAFYDMVERLSPGPRLEMFARERRLGDWQTWGFEA